MEFSDVTDEQIANLTPEQIEILENDPDKLAEILASQEDKTDKPKDEPKQEEEEGAANGAGKDDGEKEEEQDQEDEPVVLNKSGKGTIPYEKLKELRVENATLRDKLQSLQNTQAELESLRKQQAQAKTPEGRSEIQKQLKDRIAALKEDFPEIGASFDSVTEIVSDLSRQIEEDRAEAKKKSDEEAAAQKRVIDEQVQEAKENNPHLVHWEANDEDAWKEALMQDQILLQNPKWAKKTYDERFVEVVRRVKTIMPEATEPPTASPPEDKEKTKEKAKEKLEKAVVKKPTTLSDIRGGDNPTSEREQLENLSPLELAQKLLKMPDHKAAAMRAELD